MPFPRLMPKRLAMLAIAATMLACANPHPAFAAGDVPLTKTQIDLTFAPLVKRTAPAVVNIYARTVVQTRVNPVFNDPFFRRFFGNNMPMGMPRERVENSLGSGVILDKSGLVITNHHVIRNATEISVVLADRREYPAKLLLSEERTDLAVLRIETDGARDFPTLELADSDKVEVGDLVLAIGNPFGVGQTVTSGIISSNARTGVGITDFNFFLQTDAAINPGNSGGALIDVRGNVVGINTAIFSRDGGSQGIGFAVPANIARSVVAAARSGKALRRPWLGISGQQVTSDAAEALGLDRPAGVLISNVYKGSAADDAGIKTGDVVTAVDDRMIDTPEELRYRLGSRPIGEQAGLTVIRDGKPRMVTLKLAPAPEVPARQETQIKSRGALQGAKLANLSPALAEELGIDTVIAGVIVLELMPGSIAERVGLRPGDILLSVNGERIERVKDATQLRESQDGRYMLMLDRNGRQFSLRVRI